MEILINAQTDAATSGEFIVKESKYATLIANGLSSGEVVTLQIAYLNDTYTDAYNPSTNSLFELGSQSNVLPIIIPGIYRVYKTATTNAVTVSIYWSFGPGIFIAGGI